MRRTLLLFTLVLTSINISCTKNKTESTQIKQASYDDITVEEFHDLTSINDPNTVVLDVRTDLEFGAGNIPNSVNIDFRSPNFKSQISELDSSKTYLVYCQVGVRSSAAASLMTKELGFENVKNLQGGYFSWKVGD